MSSYSDEDDDQELEFASADEGSDSNFDDDDDESNDLKGSINKEVIAQNKLTVESGDAKESNNQTNENKIDEADSKTQIASSSSEKLINAEAELKDESKEDKKTEIENADITKDVDIKTENQTIEHLENKIDDEVKNLETKEEIIENEKVNENIVEEKKNKLEESSDISDFEGNHHELDSDLSDIESNEENDNFKEANTESKDVDAKIETAVDQLSTDFIESCTISESKPEKLNEELEKQSNKAVEEDEKEEKSCDDNIDSKSTDTKEPEKEDLLNNNESNSTANLDEILDSVPKIESLPTNSNNTKTEESITSTNIETKSKVELSASNEEKAIEQPKTDALGWDNADFSDIDDDNDEFSDTINTNNEKVPIDEKQSNKNESAIKNIDNKRSDNLKTESKIENKIESTNVVKEKVEEKPKVDASGWDNADFSDIEDEDLSETENANKEHVIVDEKIKAKNEPVIKSNSQLHEKQFSKQTSDTDKPKQQLKTPEQHQQPHQQQQQQQKGWGWFGSIINTASNLTTQFVETVEASLGAPDPVELAKKAKLEKEKAEAEIIEKKSKQPETKSETASKTNEPSEDKDDFDDNWNDQSGDWFSAIPINKITSTGKQLVSGSLDVLETVGKKTIEAINDKDPNLRQTREFIKTKIVTAPAKPNLSQLLREAQEESLRNENKQNTKPSSPSNKTQNEHASNISTSKKVKQEVMNFTSYFDEYKGQVHLEALEMLSRQSTVKYEMQMLNLNEKRVNSILEPLKKLFDVDDLINDEDNDDIDQNKEFDLTFFEDVFIDYMSELNIKLPIDKVIQSFKTAFYTSKEITSIDEFYNESVKSFSLIAATIVEFFHKIAESLLIQQQNNTNKKPNYMTLHKAENLCLITKLCIRSVTVIANDFCRNFKALNQDKTTSNNQTIANILLEASNGNTYIGDAFVLLSPIFKCLLIDEANINF